MITPTLIRRSQETSAPQVTLPYNFVPRDYQRDDLFRPLFPHHYPDLAVLDVPRKKRILLLHHRRAGKDKSVINALTLAAYEELGNYLYLLPEQTQAKKIIWRGIGGDGVKFIDHIPPEIIKKKYESEMLVELLNGSTIQIGGSDNYDSWMGTNPRGIILSEYSLQDPMAWQYFRPILAENGGWAVFIYTSRGKNHGYDLYNIAKANPHVWACSKRTIEDTCREDGTPVITREQYLQEIADGMPEAMAKQEFYCDFEAALMGSYYGDQMAEARAKKRIGDFPPNPGDLVFTFWDLGLDANIVIFAQRDKAGNPRVVDYYEAVNERFSNTCKEVLQKPYVYGGHFCPHDVTKRDPEQVSRIDIAAGFGIDLEKTPRGARDDGIEGVRRLIPVTTFHEENCERLLDALVSYHRIYDDKLKTFRDTPVHNWASHPADAFRCLADNWNADMVDLGWFDQKLEVDTAWVV